MNIPKLNFISKVCGRGEDINIDWCWAGELTRLPWAEEILVWKEGAMWAEFQRYNAGLGRYQSTHTREGTGGMPPLTIHSLLTTCWAVVSVGWWTAGWQGYLSDWSGNQINSQWRWRAAKCQYWTAGTKVAKHDRAHIIRPSTHHLHHHHHHPLGHR